MAILNLTGGPAGAGPRVVGRSADWGGKAVLVFALALLMAIPGAFVFALVADREHRADTVTGEVSALQGGPQQVLGPLLIVPYSIPAPPPQPGTNTPPGQPETGWYVISPEQGQAHIAIKGTTLHRSIFDVPVYEAQADIHARFAPLPKQISLPRNAVVDWSQAQIVMGFTDLRGAKSDIVGAFSDPAGHTSLTFAPASGIDIGTPKLPADTNARVSPGENAPGFGLVTAPAAAIVASPTGGDFNVSLRFTGAQRLSVMPFAKSTLVQASGDWAAPSFDGGFPPETRQTAGRTFTATWSVPFIARGLSADGPSGALSLDQLGAKDLGVTFVPANNPYTSVIRALKYAVMFVGLVFLTFFVFEALSGKRLHPAQYLMIGFAQMVFYLLLLSLSEYIGFDWAFAGAALATVGLIGLYAGPAFKSRVYQVLALVVFSIVYGLIYLLMRLDDFALLAGSIASFVGLALAMYLTRNLDWYGGKAEPPAAKPEPTPAQAPAGA
jgi:inner membrane protein